MQLFVQQPQLEQKNISKSSKFFQGVKSLWSLCFESSKKQMFNKTLKRGVEQSENNNEIRQIINDNIQITKQDNKVLIDLSSANKSVSDFKNGFSTFTPFFDIATRQRSQIRQSLKKQEKIHLKMYSDPYIKLSTAWKNQNQCISRITDKRERKQLLRNRYHKMLQNQQRETKMHKYRVDNNSNPWNSNKNMEYKHRNQKTLYGERTTKKLNKHINCPNSDFDDERDGLCQIEQASEQYLSICSTVHKDGRQKQQMRPKTILIPQFHKEQRNIKELLEKQYRNHLDSRYIKSQSSDKEEKYEKKLEIVSDQLQSKQEIERSISKNTIKDHKNIKEIKKNEKKLNIQSQGDKEEKKQSPKCNPFLQKSAHKLSLKDIISAQQSKSNQISADTNKNTTSTLKSPEAFNHIPNIAENIFVSSNNNYHPQNNINPMKKSVNNEYQQHSQCNNITYNYDPNSYRFPSNLNVSSPNNFLSNSDTKQALAMFSVQAKNCQESTQHQSIFDHQSRENTTKKSARPRRNKQMRIY